METYSGPKRKPLPLDRIKNGMICNDITLEDKKENGGDPKGVAIQTDNGQWWDGSSINPYKGKFFEIGDDEISGHLERAQEENESASLIILKSKEK